MLSFWNLQKITIFFRTAKATLAGSLKFPWHGFPKTATARKKAKTNVWKSSHGAINDRPRNLRIALETYFPFH